MCREGDDSVNIFIVTKGEFEVSKLVNVNARNDGYERQAKDTKQYLPNKKFSQQTGQVEDDFGHIKSAKTDFIQKSSILPIYKRVNIALLGEGQIHGDDDAITMRPYQASLICTVADSEVLVLSRTEFYRTFKLSADGWKQAVRQAKLKENEYLRRCRNYLDMTK